MFEKYPDLLNEEYVETYNLEVCHTNTEKDGPILDLDVAVALIRYQGNLTNVARKLARSRRVIETYISREPKLRELAEDLQEQFIDLTEDKLRGLVVAGDPSSVRYVLSTLGKKRGFVTRNEVSGKDGEGLSVTFFLPDNGRNDTYKEDETDQGEEHD